MEVFIRINLPQSARLVMCISSHDTRSKHSHTHDILTVPSLPIQTLAHRHTRFLCGNDESAASRINISARTRRTDEHEREPRTQSHTHTHLNRFALSQTYELTHRRRRRHRILRFAFKQRRFSSSCSRLRPDVFLINRKMDYTEIMSSTVDCSID